MERSRNGSCFLEDVLQTRQVTSDWSIPPKMEVTRECEVDWERPEAGLSRVKKEIRDEKKKKYLYVLISFSTCFTIAYLSP